MPHTEALAEMAGLQALDALDGQDRDAFERHLREGCRDCEASLANWEREVARLALSASEVRPPLAARAKLLDSAARSAASAPRPKSFAGALALAASVALGVLALDDAAQRRSVRAERARAAALSASLDRSREDLARRDLRVRFLQDPDVETVLLSGLAAAPGSRGKMVFSTKARRGILVAANLPPLPPGRQYELWFIAGGRPLPAGTFDLPASGAAVLESSRLPEGSPAVEKFAVTVEPRGGVALPTGPMVLLGSG